MVEVRVDCHLSCNVRGELTFCLNFSHSRKLIKVRYFMSTFWSLSSCLQFVFVFSLVQYVRPVYMSYTYPLWGELLGWGLALSSMLAVPVYALWALWRTFCRDEVILEDGSHPRSLREVHYCEDC